MSFGWFHMQEKKLIFILQRLVCYRRITNQKILLSIYLNSRPKKIPLHVRPSNLPKRTYFTPQTWTRHFSTLPPYLRDQRPPSFYSSILPESLKIYLFIFTPPSTLIRPQASTNSSFYTTDIPHRWCTPTSPHDHNLSKQSRAAHGSGQWDFQTQKSES